MPVVAAQSPTVGAPDRPTTVPPAHVPVDAATGDPTADVPANPAAEALNRVFTVLPIMLRLTCGVVGAVAALAVRTDPVQPVLLVAVVGVLTGWSLWFARVGSRSGLTPLLVGVDVALTVVTCLLIPRLVAAEVLPGEVSWVAILASTSLIVAQLILPPLLAVPAGLLVTGAYALGAHLAGNDAEAVAHATTLIVQTACGTALATVLRRNSRRADTAFSQQQRIARAALIARTAREAERRQNRDLHDTVLSTLTMVGLGAVRADSHLLRERAAADLCTLTVAGPSGGTAGSTADDGATLDADTADDAAALDVRLRAVVARFPDLPVTVDLAPCAVPAPVARALAESTAAALANVVRHAPGATVRLRLAEVAGTVVVEVADDGPGFDPTTVPAHRYGLRESIQGRLATVGGRAGVLSAPGQGTRIRLEWPDVD